MFSTVVGTYTDTVVQVARDILTDYTGEYILFQTVPFSGYDQSFELILCDRLDASGNFDFFEAYADTFYSVVLNVDEDGKIHYWYIPSQSAVIEISNSSRSLIYSSLPHTPQLVEGGVKYAFLQSAIMCGCIVFYFLGRIFRRVAWC